MFQGFRWIEIVFIEYIYDKSVNDDIFQKMILVLKYLFFVLSFEFASGLLQHNNGVVHLKLQLNPELRDLCHRER